MGRNVGGRPSKLTKVLEDKIVMLITAGNYVETACAACGLTRDSYYLWLKKGARGEEPYVSFSDRVNEAMAMAEVRDVMTIEKAAMGGVWAAAAWKLERRNPERWGRRLQIDGGLGIVEQSIELSEKDKKRFKRELDDIYRK